ncbi:MAG: VPLPA-CTERM sorting domain-containing protein [Planctomycetes bacterium]|nr:VPLPA-CTERM sorting domain-containing protein [Planctomycetota bacterium]
MVHVKHLACVATLAAVTASVSAGPVFNLNIEFSGASPPAGTAPWVTVSFAQSGADVLMTIQNSLINVEFLGTLLINVDPANVDNPSANLPTFVSGVAADLGFFGKAANPSMDNDFKADGDGFFDYRFHWSANTFDGVLTSVYRFDNMTDSWFNFVSEPGGGQGAFYAAAHIQGIAPNGQESGWIGYIPLPSAAGMAFAGLLGLGCVRRRRAL